MHIAPVKLNCAYIGSFWISTLCLASVCKPTVWTYFGVNVSNKCLLSFDFLVFYVKGMLKEFLSCFHNILNALIFVPYFVQRASAKLCNASILLFIHFNHSLYMAGQAVFPREVWGLFTVILLHVYDMWRMKKTTRTPSRSAHAIWMEVISLNRGDAKKLRATSFFFIFFYIFLLFVYPETRKIVFACHLHEENKIKLSKKLIFNIYPLTAFWQAMYQNYY